MKISEKGKDLIKRYEGFVAKPYHCPAGVPTIGYGATYYADGKHVTMQDKPITEQAASELLGTMLDKYERAVNRYVQVPIKQHQFDALVSFAYNVGLSALKNSTLLRLLNQQNYNAAAKQFLRWNRSGGRVLAGLSRRRADERKLFLGLS